MFSVDLTHKSAWKRGADSNVFLLLLLVASADERKPTTGWRRFPHPEEETQTAEAQEGKASAQTFIRSSRRPSPRWSHCPDDPTVAVATGGLSGVCPY